MYTDVISSKIDNSKGSNPIEQLKMNSEGFLKIITEGMKHQDPTSPMEIAELTNQMVCLANAHNSIETNKHLSSLANCLSSGSLISGSNIIGKNVVFETDCVTVQENKITNGVFIKPEYKTDIKMSLFQGDKMIKEIEIKSSDFNNGILELSKVINGINNGVYSAKFSMHDRDIKVPLYAVGKANKIIKDGDIKVQIGNSSCAIDKVFGIGE